MTSSSSAVSNKSRMGRYMLCAASSPDLYRINLEQGRFISPLSTQSPALNVVSRSNLHRLVACGGEDGAVECFDLRMKSSAARINAITHGGDTASEVTAIEFDETEGLQVAVGSSAGKVFMYDLRTFSAPIHVKDHTYESPIWSIKWQQPTLITTDKQIVRIWDPNTGDGMNSIGGGTNDICVFPGSGLASDSSLIPSYFIPELGPAPKWCSPLENLTVEMEETGQKTTIYESCKFVTKEDLEKLQLTPLIGTELLKAQMHGHFMNHNLYKKVYVYPTGPGRNKRAKTTVVESGSARSVQEPVKHRSLKEEINFTGPSSPSTTFIKLSSHLHPWLLWDVLRKEPPSDVASKNWETRGGPVRNQGDHDNCWSYPSTDIFSSYRWINEVDDHFRVLSARYLTFYVSETERQYARQAPTKRDDHLCYGFSLLKALQFIQTNGVPEEDSQDATRGYSCIEHPPLRKQPGLLRFPPEVQFQESNHIEELYKMLLINPVAANMMLFQPEYDNISTLDVVYEGPTSEMSIYKGLHSVLVLAVLKFRDQLVAYVKLSHGKERGAEGYMYVSLTKTIMQVNYSAQDNTIRPIKKDTEDVLVLDPSPILRDFTGIKKIR